MPSPPDESPWVALVSWQGKTPLVGLDLDLVLGEVSDLDTHGGKPPNR
jgi:hypothetical protein